MYFSHFEANIFIWRRNPTVRQENCEPFGIFVECLFFPGVWGISHMVLVVLDCAKRAKMLYCEHYKPMVLEGWQNL